MQGLNLRPLPCEESYRAEIWRHYVNRAHTFRTHIQRVSLFVLALWFIGAKGNFLQIEGGCGGP